MPGIEDGANGTFPNLAITFRLGMERQAGS